MFPLFLAETFVLVFAGIWRNFFLLFTSIHFILRKKIEGNFMRVFGFLILCTGFWYRAVPNSGGTLASSSSKNLKKLKNLNEKLEIIFDFSGSFFFHKFTYLLQFPLKTHHCTLIGHVTHLILVFSKLILRWS